MADNVRSFEGIFQRGDLYEEVFQAAGKDYRAEADAVVDLVRARDHEMTSLLDVGCGTGGHLLWFQRSFQHVEGLDIAADMVRVARSKLPGVPVHVGDMRRFDLGRRFSVITCLFSAIAYLSGAEDIRLAIEGLAGHLEPGGIVIVEPGSFPETAIDRHVFWDVAEVDGRTTARISRVVRDGDVHRIEGHYISAHPDSGIQHLVDEHVLAIVGREAYEEAFSAAGLSVEYVGPGSLDPYWRGLFVAVRR